MIEKAEKNEFLGCPITTVAQELAYFEPDVAKHFDNSLQQLIGLFHKCFLACCLGIQKLLQLFFLCLLLLFCLF